MNHLTRSLLVSGLLGFAVTASAADAAHNDYHWNLGFQGAVGWATVDGQSQYMEVEDVAEDGIERHRATYEGTTSMYGIHLGREWHCGDHSWELQLSANSVNGHMDDEYLVDEPSNDASVMESMKPEYQYNLEFSWKHAIHSSPAYLSLGTGVSLLSAKSTLTTHSNNPSEVEIHEIAHQHTIHPMGIMVSMGVGYALDEQSSLDVGVNYAIYHAKNMDDSSQLDSEDGNDSPDHIRERRSQLSLFTLTAGYSYHF